MKKIYVWFHKLPKQVQDSFVFSMSVVGVISTLFTVLGISMANIATGSVWKRIGIVVIGFILLALGYYWVIGKIYRNSVTLSVGQNHVEISCGDIFHTAGMKVIGCDTHFDIRVDDIVIAKTSLHGKLILNHGSTDEIQRVVKENARRLGLVKNADGLYDFPLGTIIKYESSVDGQTYLLLALSKLDTEYKARTNMATYEFTLMKMWKEIDRVYAGHDIALPILGNGILRFDGTPKDTESLLRCMLCTLNSSGVSFNSKIKVLIYGKSKEIPLYEYKNIFNVISRG